MNESIRKQFATETRAAGDRTIEFVLSTETVDRDNDVISAAGWQLDNFRKNPVVLWSHDYGALPIGRAQDVRVVGRTLVAKAQFAPAAMYPFAETVYAMLRGGYLNAVSVGFKPKKFARNAERGGTDFLEQELLEFSVVPVPAHQGALVVGRGVDTSAVKAWLAAGPADDDIVLVIDDEPVEPVYDVSMTEVRERTRAVVAESLNGIVLQAATDAIARLRGRIID